MSMDDFVQTLTEEQKAALIKALGGNTEVESRWQHEEPISEVVDGPQEEQAPPPDMNQKFNEFVMNKEKELEKSSKRPVRAKENAWVDTGEDRHIETPETSRTPRNRQPPKLKRVICSKCSAMEMVNESILCGEFYRCSRCVGN